jgi:hypothetical protein
LYSYYSLQLWEALDMTHDKELLPPVTHDQAWDAATNLINAFFKRDHHYSVSIPANYEKDSDLLITRYIKEQKEKDTRANPSASAPAQSDSVTESCGGVYKDFGVSPPVDAELKQLLDAEKSTPQQSDNAVREFAEKYREARNIALRAAINTCDGLCTAQECQAAIAELYAMINDTLPHPSKGN